MIYFCIFLKSNVSENLENIFYFVVTVTSHQLGERKFQFFDRQNQSGQICPFRGVSVKDINVLDIASEIAKLKNRARPAQAILRPVTLLGSSSKLLVIFPIPLNKTNTHLRIKILIRWKVFALICIVTETMKLLIQTVVQSDKGFPEI